MTAYILQSQITFRYLLVYTTFWFSISQCNMLYAQTDVDEFEPYEWFDKIVGSGNSGLYNGILFINEFNVINDKHQFLESSDFLVGSITYDNQIYYNQRLKYDLFRDEILTNPIGTSKNLVIQLRKSKTEGFFLNGHKFIRVDKGPSEQVQEVLGFCEILAEKNTVFLLKKHTKRKEDKKNNEFVYIEFYTKNSYYLFFGQKYQRANTQRDWITIFPDSKKDIKSFFKAYNGLRKSDTDAFMKLGFKQFSESSQITTAGDE